MSEDRTGRDCSLLVIVTPSFNLAATTGFLDVFRAVNYLAGRPCFDWTVASLDGGAVIASDAISIQTVPMVEVQSSRFDYVVVSSSWTPERYRSARMLAALNRWSKGGSTMGALDTGAFILAEAGLLEGQRATVHYEHWDSFREKYPGVTLSEELFTFSERQFTCCGGLAASDAALHIVAQVFGPQVSQSAARYLFCDRIRPEASLQNPSSPAGSGDTPSGVVRRAIAVMEKHTDVALTIPEICKRLNVSHRHLDRLFKQFIGRTPALHYRDIRLDRARGLVTQTDLPLSEIAVASGFSSQVHFSTSYRKRFGLPPSADRVEGRIPFEFRGKPLYRHGG